MKKPSIILLILLTVQLYAQTVTEQYSTIGISLIDYQILIEDPSHGLAIDHFHKNEDALLEFVFSESELQLLTEREISYKVIIKDYKKHFQQLVNESVNTRSVACGLDNFDSGSMGGYHTYDQMVQHINSMEELYGDFVSIIDIGKSIEDRPIYAVKISDNPEIDESEQEGVVYFEAITHAREPMSLEATLYYMWWLLENMDDDDEAKYLVHNREIYFVPIVNPDGYVYNEETDPNGGGLWRKNRLNAGNGCFGVDLNRNYPKGWGLNSGSSNNPCTQTYRGTNPLSEPETKAVAEFVDLIKPSIAFSSHTYGDKFLSPWGYVDSLASYELYAEFVSEFIPPAYDGYGTTAKMLGYTSSGTTRDHLHTEGVLTWTPEIGHSFWEPPTVICDRVIEFRQAMKYLTWVSGNYACFHDFTVQNQNIWKGDTITMDIRLKNRGLSKTAVDVFVEVSSNHPSINVVQDQVEYGSIDKREYSESSSGAFMFDVIEPVSPGERIPFLVDVYQDNSLSYSKTIYVTGGKEEVLYQTDFEIDNAWLVMDTEWDTCYMDAVSGFHSFADSRDGNYIANSRATVLMGELVSLSNTTSPYVSFNAKWSLEPEDDFVVFSAFDRWGNRTILSGLHSNQKDQYTGNSHWVQERIDLNAIKDLREVFFAFSLESDGSIHCDGIYIDDFKVSDYNSGTTKTIDVNNGFSEVRLAPNPTNGQSLLTLNWVGNRTALLQISTLNGSRVFQKPIELNNGLNEISINTQSYLAGLYIVQLLTEETALQLKLLVNK